MKNIRNNELLNITGNSIFDKNKSLEITSGLDF